MKSPYPREMLENSLAVAIHGRRVYIGIAVVTLLFMLSVLCTTLDLIRPDITVERFLIMFFLEIILLWIQFKLLAYCINNAVAADGEVKRWRKELSKEG